MDDLGVSGWRDAINKMAGLDISHVRAAVRWLAALHAATFAYLEQVHRTARPTVTEYSRTLGSVHSTLAEWSRRAATSRSSSGAWTRGRSEILVFTCCRCFIQYSSYLSIHFFAGKHKMYVFLCYPARK